MKKIRIAFIVVLLLSIFVPSIFTLFELGTFTPNPKVEIKSTLADTYAAPLRVVADFDFSPYTFYDENKELTGLDVELINEIANRLGMKPEITFTTWPNCKKALNSGEADLILGLEIFSHMTGVLKTVPASEDQLVIFGKKKINDVASLKGKRVGLMVNSIITRIFELNCEFVDYFTNSDILAAVEKGDVDFGICHGSVARKIIEKEGYKLIPSVSLMNSYPAIGVREDLPELRDKINTVLTEMSSEGFIKNLDEKWLIKFTKNPTVAQVYSENTAFYNTFLAIFIIMISAITLQFIHQSNKRKAFEKAETLQEEVTKQFDLLTSLSGIYVSMHVVDLLTDTVVEMASSDLIRKYVNKNSDAVKQMKEAVKHCVVAEDVEAALEFLNLETIAERLQGKSVLMADFRAVDIGWFCAQFIAVQTDNEGKATEVIITIQDINELKLEQEKLIKISNVDELTKLYNRHAFEVKYQEILEKGLSELTIVELDVNGLKRANDNIGHAAGDELICAAAECISKTFGTIGFSYRTGGDEFTVIIEKNLENTEEIFNQFKATVSEWHGVHIKEMAISIGIASASEISGFDISHFRELVEMADKRMYADKSSFYKSQGLDRRSR